MKFYIVKMNILDKIIHEVLLKCDIDFKIIYFEMPML